MDGEALLSLTDRKGPRNPHTCVKLMKSVQSEESTTMKALEQFASQVEEVEKKECKYEQSR